MPKPFLIFFNVLILSACSGAGLTPSLSEDNPSTPATTATSQIEAAVAVTDQSPATPLPSPTSARSKTAVPEPSETAVATNVPTVTPTAAATADVIRELAQAVPPVRDNIRLAAAFNDFDSSELPNRTAAVGEPLTAGTIDQFAVLDVVNNTYSEIDAELLAVGDHAYFWFETGPFAVVPETAVVSNTALEFDDIYEQVTDLFGREDSPGIDGDPRLHVLHASPQTICGVTPDGEGSCGTAGFVSSSDFSPASLNKHSNEREMFVMNNVQFGSDAYLGVLAHELRHLIESNHDPADTDWAKEGSAVLATELLGLPGAGVQRANAFLAQPDQQFNSWPDSGTGPYYGQGYLFNQYLYDRLGEELYSDFAVSPLPGFVALDAIAAENDLDLSGESLWFDWLSALVLHPHAQAGETYRINAAGLETAALTAVDTPPVTISTDVRQYAADYYELPTAPFDLTFSGSDFVSPLTGQSPTDETFWITQRANYSNPRLTRTVDLTGVPTATLSYDVYSDIEEGYDFAYVSISQDGGDTWIPLTASNMQGLDPLDDPSGSALAPRFYTGRSQEWHHEIVDLSPFTGQEILLRYEMVTDPILTYSGLAVDNIAIPEIDYFDGGELLGWTAEGFTLTPSTLPQRWHLQLITFPDEGPVVEHVPVSAAGEALLSVQEQGGVRRPILIVAAHTPMTLEPAPYKVLIDTG